MTEQTTAPRNRPALDHDSTVPPAAAVLRAQTFDPAEPVPTRLPLSEQTARGDELNRRLRPLFAQIERDLPMPSEVARDGGDPQAARDEIARQRRDAAERVRAELAAEWAPRDAAIAEAAQRAAQTERDAAERAPAEREAAQRAAEFPADELDGDPEVAELEARIADGDETVTADQLADARAAAVGRSRFGRLRQVAADRKARRDAERAERERVERARQAARDALHGDVSTEIARAYDDAVTALSALVQVSAQRFNAVVAFAQGQGEHVLPADERVRNHWPQANAVRLDGQMIVAEDTAPAKLVSAALNAAGVRVDLRHRSVSSLAVGKPAADPAALPVPEIVARGRAALAAEQPKPKRGKAS